MGSVTITDPVIISGAASLSFSGTAAVNIQLAPPATGNGAPINIVGATQATASLTAHPSDVTIQSGSIDNTSGSATGRAGRLRLIPGKTMGGSGVNPLVEIGASGDVPTTATLDDGAVALRFKDGVLTLFVNNGGTIQSLEIGSPV